MKYIGYIIAVSFISGYAVVHGREDIQEPEYDGPSNYFQPHFKQDPSRNYTEDCNKLKKFVDEYPRYKFYVYLQNLVRNGELDPKDESIDYFDKLKQFDIILEEGGYDKNPNNKVQSSFGLHNAINWLSSEISYKELDKICSWTYIGPQYVDPKVCKSLCGGACCG